MMALLLKFFLQTYQILNDYLFAENNSTQIFYLKDFVRFFSIAFFFYNNRVEKN